MSTVAIIYVAVAVLYLLYAVLFGTAMYFAEKDPQAWYWTLVLVLLAVLWPVTLILACTAFSLAIIADEVAKRKIMRARRKAQAGCRSYND